MIPNKATNWDIPDFNVGSLFIFSRAIPEKIKEWATLEGEHESGRILDATYMKRTKKLRKNCEECKSAVEFCAHQLLAHPKSWTNVAMDVAEAFYDELLDDALNLLDLPDARDRGRFIMKKLRKYRPDVFLH
jgi:hypothetical protein